jgi:hypothetical protein
MVKVLKHYKVFIQLHNLDLELVATVIIDGNKIIIPSHDIIIYSNGYGKGYGKVMQEHVKVLKHNIPVNI